MAHVTIGVTTASKSGSGRNTRSVQPVFNVQKKAKARFKGSYSCDNRQKRECILSSVKSEKNYSIAEFLNDLSSITMILENSKAFCAWCNENRLEPFAAAEAVYFWYGKKGITDAVMTLNHDEFKVYQREWSTPIFTQDEIINGEISSNTLAMPEKV